MAAAEEHDIEKIASATVEQSSRTEDSPAYKGPALEQTNTLMRHLEGRHMQMIAIGKCASENSNVRQERSSRLIVLIQVVPSVLVCSLEREVPSIREDRVLW